MAAGVASALPTAAVPIPSAEDLPLVRRDEDGGRAGGVVGRCGCSSADRFGSDVEAETVPWCAPAALLLALGGECLR